MSEATNATTLKFTRPTLPRRALSYSVIEAALTGTEALVIIACGVLGGSIYWLVVDASLGDISSHARLGLFASALYLLTSLHSNRIRLQSTRCTSKDRVRVLTAWAITVAMTVATLFLLKIGGSVSRGSVVCFAVLGAASLAGWRTVAAKALSAALERGIARGRTAIVVGTRDELSRVTSRDLLVQFGISEAGRVLLPPQYPLEANELAAVVTEARNRAGEVEAEEFILAVPWRPGAEIETAVDLLRASPLPVRLLPDRAISDVLSQHVGLIPGSVFVDVKRAPLTRLERTLKRVFDVAVATVSLAVLAPIMAVAAVAIRLETPGPVIFRQRRRGFNGREFMIRKFRTMRVLEDGAAFVQAKKGDPRVTLVGRTLRKTSIDELPQLIDVLKGDMSIVGPRPHPIALDNQYERDIADYAFRHHVKPGITGWAQVNGYRGETPRVEIMAARIKHDLWYVDNWSFALDVKIVCRTFFELLRSPNAY